MDGPLDTADVRAFAGDGFVIKRGWFDADEMELLGIVRPMIYVYSTANGAGRIMGYEPLEEPWPGLFLVAVFDDDQLWFATLRRTVRHADQGHQK